MSHRILFPVFLLVILMMGCATTETKSPAVKSPKPAPQPVVVTPDPGPSSGRLQMVLFSVMVPKEKLASFDTYAMVEATKSTAEFEKALQEFGETEVLYWVNQSVSMRGAVQIKLDNSMPVSSNSGGKTSYHYTSGRLNFGIVPGRTSNTHIQKIDLSLTGSPKASGALPTKKTVSLEGLLPSSKPSILTCIDATFKYPDGTSTAFVVRSTLIPNQ